MKHPRWRVPRMWEGEIVAIIGGGPSLTAAQVEACRGRCRIIAVNTGFKLAPFADILYWSDESWGGQWREHPDFKAFQGMKVALENARTWTWDPSIKVLENYGDDGLCELPDGVMTMRNSGAQAMQLAYHLGARAELLLGFDMRVVGGRTHFHSGTKDAHARETPWDCFKNDMLPKFPALKEALDRKGVCVINCSPASALEVFAKMTVEDALASLQLPPRPAPDRGYFKVAGL